MPFPKHDEGSSFLPTDDTFRRTMYICVKTAAWKQNTIQI